MCLATVERCASCVMIRFTGDEDRSGATKRVQGSSIKGIDPEQPKGMAESSLSARPPPLQYEWSQNMTNLQKNDSEHLQKSQKNDSEYRQKMQKNDSECDQKLSPYTISGHESLSGLRDPIFSETLTAESLAKVKSILAEHDLKQEAIGAEHDLKQEAIGAEHDLKQEAIEAEHDLKQEAIVAEHHLKQEAIVAEREARLADERNRT